ncbi:rho GTPase-activating protein 19-like isoform X1 [Asterias rubens]|uniref:rho GTPase-activating protein 19-like isoform X1 n=1 Tax=Asterias rubens TaxID=7604 RepID=UPI001455B025|nr:rho GTPase-activating protein 19-like isoform X1 [Asterias rubens]
MSTEYLCNPLHYVEAMKHKHPAILKDWCCTELSHVLDFSGSDGLGQVLAGIIDIRQGKTFVKKFSRNKQKSYGVTSVGCGVFGAPLTEEGYCQARQLIDFLKDYISKEGIFRIPGNSERQRRLKDKIGSGLLVDLDNDVFTAHDVACVLKTYLGDLPEPLLTDKHYPAHVQAAGLTFKMNEVPCLTEELGKQYKDQKTRDHITALRYLFLMLPPVYLKMLRELLELLHSITEHEQLNKMSAFNLGVMFAPHILWPRYLTADDLRDQVFVNKLNCGVEFMITHFHKIFKVPAKMLKRCEQYIKYGKLTEDEEEKPARKLSKDECDSKRGRVISAPQTASVEVKKEKIQTEAALAQLYAHVQEMPPSSKKRKLMKQFAKNSNMPGTPTRVKEDVLVNSRQRKHTRSKSVGDVIVKHISTPGYMKKRRPAPLPPAEHEETAQQRGYMRDVRHEMRDQLRRTCANSWETPPTERHQSPHATHQHRSKQSTTPTSTTRQKRPAPLTPKQLQQLGQVSTTPKTEVVKPVPAVRSSIQTRKRRSDGQPSDTPTESTGRSQIKPVPKPRIVKENSPLMPARPSHHHRRQQRQANKHELNSLV